MSKNNGKTTDKKRKPGTENIIGQGFHTHPERINKNGRPLGSRSLGTILREMLEETVEIEINGVKEKKTLSDILVRKLITKASRGDGDVRAIAEIFDRVDGKPKENEGQPTEMNINVKRRD